MATRNATSNRLPAKAGIHLLPQPPAQRSGDGPLPAQGTGWDRDEDQYWPDPDSQGLQVGHGIAEQQL